MTSRTSRNRIRDEALPRSQQRHDQHQHQIFKIKPWITVVGRKNFYGSGSVDSAELASRAWTILATAERAGYNPLAYLTSYLDACATNAAKPPTGDHLARFLPWTASPTDQDTWQRPGAGHPTPGDDTTTTDATSTDDTPDDTAGPAP
jgi:hypothetical protein